jgi:hypothetical protein
MEHAGYFDKKATSFRGGKEAGDGCEVDGGEEKIERKVLCEFV